MAEAPPGVAVSDVPARSGANRLRAALFATPVDAIAHVSLLLAAIIFLLAMPYFTRGGSKEFVEDLFQHAYVLIWLMAVTILGRTLRLRVLAAFFFLGLFASVLVVQWIGVPLRGLSGGGRFYDSLLIPLLEEGAKALPIVLVFWVLTRNGWQPSMTDGLLLGFVIGAGIAIHEDALYQRVYGSGLGDSTIGQLFPTLGEQSTISRAAVYGFYHSGWASLSGLAIGAWFMLRRRFKWAFLIAIFGFAVVVFDHGIGNYIIENQGVGGFGLLWTLNLDGMLPVYLLLVGIPAAIVAELLIQRRQSGADRLFPGLAPSSILGSSGSGVFARLMHVQAARNYIRARRALHYLLWADPKLGRRRELLLQTVRADAAARDAGVVIPNVTIGKPA